jgi:ketosteroid isomerase-like protein
MQRRKLLLGAVGGGIAAQQRTESGLRERVAAVERSFAASMAARDAKAFAAHLSDEAVFIGSEDKPPLRGKKEVAAGWQRFFEGPEAPFSWAPEMVEVLPSGTLALSSGPVRNPKGELIGRFTSIWRREADSNWRIVFDRGCPVCSR